MSKEPWNKNKSVGQKKPISDSQINHLREYLTNQNNLRDLSLFSLQIDTMVRSSDLIKLKVDDVMNMSGEIVDMINIKQKKTRNPHIVIMSDITANILLQYIKKENLQPHDFLFQGYRAKHICYDMHRRLWKKWIAILGIDPRNYSTHTGRRTRATMVYKDTKDPLLVMKLLGQKNLSSTTEYLGMDKQNARDIYKEKFLK